MAVRSSCILPLYTVSHGGQIIVHSASQHMVTWRSHRGAFHWSTLYHMVVRSSFILPVNTGSYGGQNIVHSTSQHNTTWWSDHHAFHQSTQGHMVIKSLCIPPVNTGSHGGQIECFVRKEAGPLRTSRRTIFWLHGEMLDDSSLIPAVKSMRFASF